MLAFAALSSLALALASPAPRWYSESLGANYFQTNGFGGNQLVASYIMPDGSLKAGTATCTGGTGSAGINDPSPYENHPDPFYGGGSVIVAGDQVFAVNAGSGTFSAFNIDPTDPARPALQCTYPSYGDYPISLAASADGKYLCVLDGGKMNGFRCYLAGAEGWVWLKEWDRGFGLNLTTPPHGPVGGTPSQMTFASDMSALIVSIKGRVPSDLNNPTNMTQPGYMAVYPIGPNYTLAETPMTYPAALPFSISEDMYSPGAYMASDVSTGYAAFDFATNKSVQGTVADQAAVCWVAQSKLTGSFYVVDIAGLSNITEVALNGKTLQGTTLSAQPLGNNSAGTDNSIFSSYTQRVDWMYVNAPAYQSVHAFTIKAPGEFYLFQQFNLGDMPREVVPSMGFAGQAVYYK